MHRLDVFRSLEILAERAAREAYDPIERRGSDITMTPDRIEQLIPGQELSRPREKLRQRSKNLRLDRMFRAAPSKRAVHGIEFAIAAAVGLIQIQSLTNSSSITKDCRAHNA
jgi:hypothetical protein